MKILEKFEGKVFNSRIHSEDTTRTERWLGYFWGPAGVAIAYIILAGSYLNMYYTDVLKINKLWGGLFLTLLPIVSKIFDAVTNIIMGRIIDKTRTAQGKARPWLLISGPCMAISGILLYAIPKANTTIQMLWVMISYTVYFSFSYTIYSMSHVLMVPLSTRNTKQRDGLAMLTNVGAAIIPGSLVAIVFPMIALPWMGVNQERWIGLMTVFSIIALPAVILEYYFTKERITEEATEAGKQENISFIEQLKGCLRSREWKIVMAVVILIQFMNIYNSALIYFCNWVLGTYNDGITQPIVQSIGQAPLGLGIIVLWPLVKKFGKRRTMMVGSFIAAVGCAIVILKPTSMAVVLGGSVIRSIGMIPTYILMALLAEALDHVEWVNGFRCDGISASIYSIILTAMAGVSTGVFNLGLTLSGYVAPYYVSEGVYNTQSGGVQNFITFATFGTGVIAFIIIGILMIIYKGEALSEKVQKELKEKRISEE